MSPPAPCPHRRSAAREHRAARRPGDDEAADKIGDVRIAIVGRGRGHHHRHRVRAVRQDERRQDIAIACRDLALPGDGERIGRWTQPHHVGIGVRPGEVGRDGELGGREGIARENTARHPADDVGRSGAPGGVHEGNAFVDRELRDLGVGGRRRLVERPIGDVLGTVLVALGGMDHRPAALPGGEPVVALHVDSRPGLIAGGDKRVERPGDGIGETIRRDDRHDLCSQARRHRAEQSPPDVSRVQSHARRRSPSTNHCRGCDEATRRRDVIFFGLKTARWRAHWSSAAGVAGMPRDMLGRRGRTVGPVLRGWRRDLRMAAPCEILSS